MQRSVFTKLASEMTGNAQTLLKSLSRPLMLGLCLAFAVNAFAAKSLAGRQSVPPLERVQVAGKGMLYTFHLPAESPYRLALGVSSRLATVDSPVWKQNGVTPLFLINAGFFDPQNSLTTSHLRQGGKVVGDPRQNPHLVENPKLSSYLPQIFNRSEFRVYQCAQNQTRYDITVHDSPTPQGCTLADAAGSGPMLLPERTDREEAFIDTDAQGRRIRDPIGVDARNARSVIGLLPNGDVLLMMGAQTAPGQGFSLADMAGLLKQRGVTKAIALDGGSSSSLKARNEVIFGRLNSKGELVKRPVKSVWMVVPTATR